MERSRPEAVALSDPLHPAYQKPSEEIRGRCRIDAEVFVAGVRGRPREAPQGEGNRDLVDEMNLLIVPVVVGQGTRLFPDTGPDIALDLVESRAFPKGITIQVYRPAGRPQYATA
jgi:hypothetical protein